MSLNLHEIEMIREKAAKLKIAVIGDCSLDIYWTADMKRSNLSREVPNFSLPVVEEKYSLGAAGNIANNLTKLGVQAELVTIVGKDWRGTLMKELLEIKKIGFIHSMVSEERITSAFCKSLKKGIAEVVYEDSRLDFENHIHLGPGLEERFVKKLLEIEDKFDGFIVLDQFKEGIITEKVREVLADIGSRGKFILVDSKYEIEKFRNTIIKCNEAKAEAAYGKSLDFQNGAKLLAAKTGKPVIITLGEKGAVWCTPERTAAVKGFPAKNPIDIAGCGDCFSSAFTTAYLLGMEPEKTVEFANIAASVTVKKVGTKSGANIREIIARYRRVRYGAKDS